MLSLLDAAGRTMHRAVFRRRVAREMRRLKRIGSDRARVLAAALQDTVSDPAGDAIPRDLARIEAYREALLVSTEQVSFHDYGVPSRMGHGSPERSTVTRSLAGVARASAPRHEARLLYHLIRRLRPAACLELGTCLGISAAYQAAALAANEHGRLVTLEGGAALAQHAREHLARLGLTRVQVVEGAFRDTLPDVLLTHGPFDFAFVDGHHDPAATRAYFDLIARHLAPGAVLVFDDIAWTLGMRKAWKTIVADERIHAAADLLVTGIGFFDAADSGP